MAKKETSSKRLQQSDGVLSVPYILLKETVPFKNS